MATRKRIRRCAKCQKPVKHASARYGSDVLCSVCNSTWTFNKHGEILRWHEWHFQLNQERAENNYPVARPAK